VLAQAKLIGLRLAVHRQELVGDPDEVPAVVEELGRPAVGVELLRQVL